MNGVRESAITGEFAAVGKMWYWMELIEECEERSRVVLKSMIWLPSPLLLRDMHDQLGGWDLPS